MTDQVGIKPGDFAVVSDGWNKKAYKVTKVTEKCFWYFSDGRGVSGRETRRDRAGVVFSGSQEKADLLVKQLESSWAQKTADERTARERMERRDAQVVAEATR